MNHFLKEHKNDLLVDTPPFKIFKSDPLLALFWEHEKHRLAVDPDYWFPLAFELYLHTSTMCGIIDRVDPIDDHSCCLVEYKSSREHSGFLYDELLFYALLATHSKVFAQKIPLEVVQVGCYFYETGEYITKEVTPSILADFYEFFMPTRDEISLGTWSPKQNCSLRKEGRPHAVLCTLIPDRLKYRT